VKSVVIREFSNRQLFCPIVLPVIAVEPQVLFKFLIDSFGLSVCLRVVGGVKIQTEEGNKVNGKQTDGKHQVATLPIYLYLHHVT